MTEFGPYPQDILDQIDAILSKTNLHFRIRKIKPTRPKSPLIRKGYQGALNVGYVQISNNDLDRIPDKLEKFGIIKPHEDPGDGGILNEDENQQELLTASNHRKKTWLILLLLIILYLFRKLIH